MGEAPPEPRPAASGIRIVPFSELRPVAPERLRVWRTGEEIDLDKIWHVIHFVLTGSAGKSDRPEGSLLADDLEIGARDVGAGRPWALLPEQTARFAQAVAPLQFEDMKDRFDVAAMRRKKVYLAQSVDADAASFTEVWRQLLKLQKFLETTAQNGEGLILFMV
jgi:hypothetical protein